ncbi:hypothetical protein HKW87_31240, partial [Pseudomonas aeruginosa]|nr:hypothetical protein [Pseudomonas aeruginosa]
VPPAALVGPQPLHLQFAAQRCVLLPAAPAESEAPRTTDIGLAAAV